MLGVVLTHMKPFEAPYFRTGFVSVYSMCMCLTKKCIYCWYRAAMKMANIDAVFNFMFTQAVKSEKPECPVSWRCTCIQTCDVATNCTCIANNIVWSWFSLPWEQWNRKSTWYAVLFRNKVSCCILLISVLVQEDFQNMFFGGKSGMQRALASLWKVQLWLMIIASIEDIQNKQD